MKYLILVILTLFIFSCRTTNKEEKNLNSETKKPNIVILLADDLGYGELGSYGQEIIKTPVLDNLASEGLRFTNFYSGNAVCSPSRAVLMTGISSTFNNNRGNSGYFQNEEANWQRVALKKNEITLAEMLKEAGYQTGFVGKWHLDDANDLTTWAYGRGFDFAVQEQWSMRSGGREFTANMEYINGMKDSIFYDVNKWQSKDEFRTELALQHLDSVDKKKPFFLFMSYRAPHGHEKTIGNKTLYSDEGWNENNRVHAAKITLLDEQIGRLLSKLKEMGELDNTVVIFTSDNGPHLEGNHNPEYFNSNGPFKGYKRDLYEGGIRVPKIVYWKDKVEASSVTDHVGSFQDIMPTIAEIAGSKIPEQTNGISLLPLLKGKQNSEHDYLTWEILLDGYWKKHDNGGFRQSARAGRWKAVRYDISQKIQLFDLSVDREEQNDIASQHPEVVKYMTSILESNRSNNEYFPFGGVHIDDVELNTKLKHYY